MEGIPTGVDFLDSGADGFFRTKPYLVFGASGTGKSILGLQYAHAGLERGEGALYVCREKAEDLIGQAERLSLSLARAIDDEDLVFLEYDEGFRDMVTAQGPEAVIEELTGQVDERRISRVIFDPVDPFFSSLDDESLLRSQLRSIAEHFESLGWTPLLLCDDATVSQRPFILRVFSEVCWGLFELRRGDERGSPDHSLLVYKMRNVDLSRSRFEFRFGEGGIHSASVAPGVKKRRPTFARFQPASRPASGDAAGTATQTRAEAAASEIRAEPPDEPHVEPPDEPRVETTGEPPDEPHVETTGEPHVEMAQSRRVERPPRGHEIEPPASSFLGADDLEEAEPAPDAADLLDDQALEQIERQLTRRLHPRPEADVSRRTSSARAPSPTPEPRTVALVIDPDDEARAQVARALERDMMVLEAPDGLAGLQAAVGTSPDLVLTNAAMPRLGGVGLCRILREHGVDVPILVLCSPRVLPGERARCLMAGGNEILPKPIETGPLRAAARRLLKDHPAGSTHWPEIDLVDAPRQLLPRRVEPAELGALLARAEARAREIGIPICLLGYEFRFVANGGGHGFADHFTEALFEQVRAEDAICRLDERRLLAMLVDADDAGARTVVGRLHERMSADAAGFVGEQPVKPKALYRLLTLQPEPLADDPVQRDRVAQLFERPPQLIEEDGPDHPGRPGERVERYPLLEAVDTALWSDGVRVASPLDGSSYAIVVGPSGVRSTSIDGYEYACQDPQEETPTGFRARRGARIVWVTRAGAGRVARIEDGRVLRGREL